MATPRKSKASRTTLAKSTPELLLHDFRIASCKCERFMAPEKAEKGSFTVGGSSRIGVAKTGAGQILVEYTITLQGYSRPADNEETKREKSFSIELITEAMFKSADAPKIARADISNEIARNLMAQVYPLTLLKVRVLAAEMGYRNVRPVLGISPSRLTNSGESKAK